MRVYVPLLRVGQMNVSVGYDDFVLLCVKSLSPRLVLSCNLQLFVLHFSLTAVKSENITAPSHAFMTHD